MKSTETNKSDLENLLKNLEGDSLVRIAMVFGSFGKSILLEIMLGAAYPQEIADFKRCV